MHNQYCHEFLFTKPVQIFCTWLPLILNFSSYLQKQIGYFEVRAFTPFAL